MLALWLPLVSQATQPASQDSLRLEQLAEQALQTAETDPSRALILATDLQRFAARARSTRGHVLALRVRGWALTMQGHLSQGEQSFQAALPLAERLADKTLLAQLRLLLAHVQRQRGNYPAALAGALQALRQYEHVHDTLRQARALQTMSNIETDLKNFSQGTAYGERAKQLLLRARRPPAPPLTLAITYTGLASNYAMVPDAKRARRYFLLALAGYRQLGDSLRVLATLYNLGEFHLRRRELKAAGSFLAQAQQRVDQLGNAAHGGRVGLGQNVALASGELALLQGDYVAADRHLNLARRIAERSQDLRLLPDVYENLAKVKAAQGQYQAALRWHKRGDELKDSLMGPKATAQMATLRAQYNRSRQAQQLQAQRFRIRELEQQSRLNRLGAGLGTVLVVALAALGWLAWQRVQLRAKAAHATQALHLQAAEDRLARQNLELTSLALGMSQKSELLETLKGELYRLGQDANEAETVRQQVGKLRQRLEQQSRPDQEWEQFRLRFEQVHPSFFMTLQQRFPTLTPHDLRLAALLRLNFASKPIASLLGISDDGVRKARHRLRQKLDLPTNANITDFLMRL
ncbi:helix-turn-helix transcriptional regulator [Hymenobacter terrenus]|uniref:helix-turn-helix transcriptional regulator n=1 Tax=Hymenobacter terrenus TaxID=1629124 RepID=UPI0006194664|nr:hypothetical protein [Hymenobacter terrenus]